MWNKISRVLDEAAKHLGWLPLLFGCGVVTAVGSVSAWIAIHTAWLAAYGPAAWWFSGLIGALLLALLLLVAVTIRYHWIKGSAVRQWKEKVDSINPMDSEFNKKRIKIADIVSPITRTVRNKRFIDCELIGPANIVFLGVNATGTAFTNCDLVMIKPTGSPIVNVIPFENVLFLGGFLHQCTIYIPHEHLKTYLEIGGNFVSLTGNPDVDNQSVNPNHQIQTNRDSLAQSG